MPIIDVSGSFDELAVGSYVGIVTGKTYITNEKQGSMKVAFKVSIDGREYRTKLYPLEGKGQFYLYQALQDMGANVPKRFELDDVQIEGLKAEFIMSTREVNGKTYRDLEPTSALGRATEEEYKSGVPF